MPRFCGHTVTTVPYNIAQHSLFVADEIELMLVENATWDRGYDRLIMLGLLHDAEEIYTGDWPSPVKRLPALHPIIKKIEADLKKAIFESLGLLLPTEEEEAIIKKADRIAQKIEAHAFMPSRGKDWPNMPSVSLERLQQFSAPLDSLTSYKLFMKKFDELATELNIQTGV
jgi:5'-deoxynucleotidase YfbR-like HD superfamily hydrolase